MIPHDCPRFPCECDRRPDESTRDFWDRKRRERHGPGCRCPLCLMAGDNPAEGS